MMLTNLSQAAVRSRAAVLAMALLAGLTAAAQAQPMPGMHGPGPGAHAGPMGGGRMIGQALEVAGASAEQRAQVHAIMKAARDELRSQRASARAEHQQMAQLMTAPQLDPAAVEAVRQRISARRDAASQRMVRAMLDASAVLTPEQRQKVGSFMAQRREMAERHRRERESLRPGTGG